MLRKIESYLGLWPSQLDARAAWLFNLFSRFCKKRLKMFLYMFSKLKLPDGDIIEANLEGICKKKHLAAIFVVLLSISPDEAYFFFEGIPRLKVCNSGDFMATMLPVTSLENAPQ